MSYLDKNLLDDETILFRTRKHIIIYFWPLVWTLFSIYASYYMHSNEILEKFEWAPWLVAAIFWMYTWLEWMTSEFAVTNKRIMMREGFFVRHSNEMRLNAISQVNVVQSLLGQMFNYGTVTINAFGAFDAYTLIDKPFLFQRYVNQQTDRVMK